MSDATMSSMFHRFRFIEEGEEVAAIACAGYEMIRCAFAFARGLGRGFDVYIADVLIGRISPNSVKPEGWEWTRAE
jgi:hypothetical protein